MVETDLPTSDHPAALGERAGEGELHRFRVRAGRSSFQTRSIFPVSLRERLSH